MEIEQSKIDDTYWGYSYDSKGQVTGGVKYDAQDNPITNMYFGYDFDDIGNRTWEKRPTSSDQYDYTTNSLNQYTQLELPDNSTVSYTYDDDGNMTGDDTWLYTWNAENRLTTAVKTDDTKLEFAYDYIGRRFSKKVYSWNSGTSRWDLDKHELYVYDNNNRIATYNGSTDTLTKSYVWGQDLSLSLTLIYIMKQQVKEAWLIRLYKCM